MYVKSNTPSLLYLNGIRKENNTKIFWRLCRYKIVDSWLLFRKNLEFLKMSDVDPNTILNTTFLSKLT